MIRAIGIGMAAALLLCAAPSTAQQSTKSTSNAPLMLELQPPADAGKPRYFSPPDLPPPAGCAGVLDCRVRVLGAVQHNGAVEVNGALLKW